MLILGVLKNQIRSSSLNVVRRGTSGSLDWKMFTLHQVKIRVHFWPANPLCPCFAEMATSACIKKHKCKNSLWYTNDNSWQCFIKDISGLDLSLLAGKKERLTRQQEQLTYNYLTQTKSMNYAYQIVLTCKTSLTAQGLQDTCQYTEEQQHINREG